MKIVFSIKVILKYRQKKEHMNYNQFKKMKRIKLMILINGNYKYFKEKIK
jgi:hypothetical protein